MATVQLWFPRIALALVACHLGSSPARGQTRAQLETLRKRMVETAVVGAGDQEPTRH